MCRSVTAAMAEYLPCLTAVALLGTRGLIRNSFIRLNAMICNSVAYSRKKKTMVARRAEGEGRRSGGGVGDTKASRRGVAAVVGG